MSLGLALSGDRLSVRDIRYCSRNAIRTAEVHGKSCSAFPNHPFLHLARLVALFKRSSKQNSSVYTFKCRSKDSLRSRCWERTSYLAWRLSRRSHVSKHAQIFGRTKTTLIIAQYVQDLQQILNSKATINWWENVGIDACSS